MVGSDDKFERSALPILSKLGWTYEEISPDGLKKRFPQINLDGVRWAIFEPDGGYLQARESCRVVVNALRSEGGEYRELAVQRPSIHGNQLGSVQLSDGSSLAADYFVFACGPWLGAIFPDVLGERIFPSRQEVFFFGPPLGDTSFCEGQFPVWADHQGRLRYGIPANEGRGFKVADDTRGPIFDPTYGDRVPSAESIAAIRQFVGFRFPALAKAPLIEARVCQYENSPDTNFIVDRHPVAQNVWLVGGGSGHGFKHGPAIGELVSGLVLGKLSAPHEFSLSRFEAPGVRSAHQNGQAAE
jgi:glycine/D-amino acid oxidase-like deaminating enzyme